MFTFTVPLVSILTSKDCSYIALGCLQKLATETTNRLLMHTDRWTERKVASVSKRLR